MSKPTLTQHVRLNTAFCAALLAGALSAGGGCTTFDLGERIPWGMGEEGRIERPVEVTAVWTDAVQTKPGEPAKRGFGGRIMFYKRNRGKPVKVAGELVVYAFDESNRQPGRVAPDRKFVFPVDQLEHYYSKSKMGHSYSVWLPFDAVGGEQKRISLIVRFITTDGAAVIGEQTQHVLPGPEPLVGDTAISTNRSFDGTPAYDVQQVQYTEPSQAPVWSLPPVDQIAQQQSAQRQAGQSPPSAGRQMRTTTIELPQRVGGQLPFSSGAARQQLAPRTLPADADQGAAIQGMPAAAPPPTNAIPAGTMPSAVMQPMAVAQGPQAFPLPPGSAHSAPQTLPAPNVQVAQQPGERRAMQPPPAGWQWNPAAPPAMGHSAPAVRPIVPAGGTKWR